MFASFRSRLVLSNLLITLVGLLLVVAVSTYVLAERNKQDNKDRYARESRNIAIQIDRLLARHGGTKELFQTVRTAANVLGQQVVVIRLNRSIVVDSLNKKSLAAEGIVPLLNARALHEQKSALTQINGPNHFVFQSPIHVAHRHSFVGAVLLVAYVTDVQPAFGPLLAVALGVALFIWLLVGLYFTVSISRPLVLITAATDRIARGDYSARVPGRGHGELSRLAGSFNHMAQTVDQSNRVLKDFVANVSHDLRTPLTMIAGFSQALLDGTAHADEAESSAAIIHEEAEKMQRLVDDLLQLTKLESGLLKLQRHPTEIRAFVQALVERVERSSGDQPRATVSNHVPFGLPLVDIDPGQMERALRNLVDNALRYTPPDGTVVISAARIGRGWVEVQVADTGTGIAGQDLSRVFERFYRSDRSRERGQGHSGLGLAIVREIVEGHGGQVRVESEEGKGTTFRFTVPQARKVELEADTVSSRSPRPKIVTQE